MPRHLIYRFAAIVLLALFLAGCDEKRDGGTAGKTISGRVTAYFTNRIGDIDKLVLEHDKLESVVHFPPHTASAVMKLAPENAVAEFQVEPGKNKEKHRRMIFEMRSVATAAGNLSIRALPPIAPSQGRMVRFKGKPKLFSYNNDDKVSALIVDKYLVDLPPPVMKNLLPVIQGNADIQISAYERTASAGFVNTTGLTVVKPFAITINDTDYVL